MDAGRSTITTMAPRFPTRIPIPRLSFNTPPAEEIAARETAKTPPTGSETTTEAPESDLKRPVGSNGQELQIMRSTETNGGNQLAWNLRNPPVFNLGASGFGAPPGGGSNRPVRLYSLAPLNDSSEDPTPTTTIPPSPTPGTTTPPGMPPTPSPTTPPTAPFAPPPGTTVNPPVVEEPLTLRGEVDRILSPEATSEQRAQAYEVIEDYVEAVGGLGDKGINIDALADRSVALLQDEGIPTTRDDNARHLVKTPLDSVFSEESRRALIDSQYDGADHPDLRDATVDLLKFDSEALADPANRDEVNDIVRRIADARGVPYSTLQQDLKTYQELLAIQEHNHVNGNTQDFQAHSEFIKKYPDYFGSTEALRYGDILGQVYDIDPAFGSALSPTGGLPGDGENVIGQIDDVPPILYHAAYHDAIGHLRIGHNIETELTYDYVGLEPDNIVQELEPYLNYPDWLKDRFGPEEGYFTGQATGIAWWMNELGYFTHNPTPFISPTD